MTSLHMCCKSTSSSDGWLPLHGAGLYDYGGTQNNILTLFRPHGMIIHMLIEQTIRIDAFRQYISGYFIGYSAACAWQCGNKGETVQIHNEEAPQT